MKAFVILVDSREQAPLPFPPFITFLDSHYRATDRRTLRIPLVVRKATLGAADYAPLSAPLAIYSPGTGRPAGIVERKFSIDEVAGNTVTGDARRANFVACLKNMRRAWGSRARLLLDGGWGALYHPSSITLDTACCARDALQRLELEYSVPIIPLASHTPTQRARIADWVARWLINSTLTSEAPELIEPTPPLASEG